MSKKKHYKRSTFDQREGIRLAAIPKEETFTPTLARVLELARQQARKDQSYLGINHVLIAMLQGGKNFGSLSLQAAGFSIEGLRKFKTPDNASGMTNKELNELPMQDILNLLIELATPARDWFRDHNPRRVPLRMPFPHQPLFVLEPFAVYSDEQWRQMENERVRKENASHKRCKLAR